jgi:hypothetical protein
MRWLLLASGLCLPLRVLAGAPAPASAADPLPLIDTCIQRVAAEDEEQYDSYAKLCPDLLRALSGSTKPRLRQVLKAEDEADSYLLEDLRASLRLSGTQVRELPLDHAGLKALLDDTLVKKPGKKVSLRERFFEWLRSLFPEPSEEDSRKWEAWLKAIMPPAWVIELIWRLSIAALLILALWFVVNEVRLSGMRIRLRRKPGGLAGDALLPDTVRAPDTRAVNIDEADAPALLRYAIRVLNTRGQLPERQSATVRELLGLLRQTAPQAINSFEIIGLCAERGLFGGSLPEREDLAAARAAARSLTAPAQS